ASKLSSGQVELNREKTDLTELLNQALGEYEGRFRNSKLELVTNDFPRAFIYTDPGCTWRIFDNIFENICKYAMSGTRIYVDYTASEGVAYIKIKNVSAIRPRFQGDELTERFIRGDESRSGEGSGLGLFIAKSLTQAQGGTFKVIVDGDMFVTDISIPEFSSELEEKSTNRGEEQ
ncbi:MAG: sensor histidine kinase, partial [Lachnospiraceae bacterium]|nr:sensor histidine kinase [Lachnospiraceae bacterium]